MSFHSFGGGGAGSGDVTAASNLTNEYIVRGDGGAKGVKKSGIKIDVDNRLVVDSVTNFSLTMETQTIADTAGYDMTLSAAHGLGTGAGGGFFALAGNGGDDGPGGIANLVGGTGGAGGAGGGGDGGNVLVEGGPGGPGLGGGRGGDVILRGGLSTENNNGGAIGLEPSLLAGAGVARYVYIKDPATGFTTSLDTGSLSASRVHKIPDADGTFALKHQVLPGETVIITSDVVNAEVVADTMTDVTGLSFPVVSGSTYSFKFMIIYTAAATTTGSRWSINGPATTLLGFRSSWPLTITTVTVNNRTAYDVPTASSTSSGNTAGNIAFIEGFITPSADGTVIARFASEVTASAITAKAGSFVQFLKVI